MQNVLHKVLQRYNINAKLSILVFYEKLYKVRYKQL